MDQRERSNDYEESVRAALDGRQSKMWTALPGVIQSFNAEAETAVVQTAIQAKQSTPDGSVKLVTMPLCLDCPVQFPGGGGVSLTFPVAAGDECLVVFSSRAIDGWWQSGGVQAPVEARMHDLSDGFVLLGFRSQPRVLSGISTTTAQLRSDDGSTFVELDPEAQTLNLVAPGGITLNGIVWDTHKHTGVQTGSGDTGGPV